MAEQLEMRTEDLSQEKIRMLGELFPNCITESREREWFFQLTSMR